MNLANKITMVRIFLSILLIVLLMFPYDLCGIDIKLYQIKNVILVNPIYVVCGVIFLIAALTDHLDGKIARKNNLVTDFGKVMDAIADKILVNGILIVLACEGVILPIVPVIIILRDTFVDSVKMVAGSKGSAVGASFLGKLKTVFMLCGLTLVFFYNMPFELWNIDVANGLIYIATVLSIVSGVQYFTANREYFKEK